MNSHLLPSDASWRDDKALISELSALSTKVTRYILHQLDADAQRAEPPSVEEERSLAEHLAGLAAKLQGRADQRAAHGNQPGVAESTSTDSSPPADDTDRAP